MWKWCTHSHLRGWGEFMKSRYREIEQKFQNSIYLNTCMYGLEFWNTPPPLLFIFFSFSLENLEKKFQNNIQKDILKWKTSSSHNSNQYLFTTIYVSSYYYVRVLILVYMCPHTTICVSSYYYICVLILLFVCPHTSIYVSSY